MANVSPLMGNVQNAAPMAARQTLPLVPKLQDFSAVLTNLMDLLKGLFDGSIQLDPNKDFSKDLGLGPQQDLVPMPEKSDPYTPADPIRDFAAREESVRDGLIRQIDEKLDELPYEDAAVQIEEIRRLVQQIDARGMVGEESGDPGTVADDVMRAVNNLRHQFSLQSEVGGEQTARSSEPVAPLFPVNTGEEEPEFQLPLNRPTAPPRPVVTPPAPPAVPETAPLPNPLGSQEPPPPEPPPAPPVKPPAVEAMLQKALGAKVEEVHVEPPVQEPVAPTTTSQTTVPSVAQALAAQVQAEVPNADGSRPAVTPVRATEGSLSRTQAESAAPAKPAPNPVPRSQERVEFVERIIRAAKLTRTRGQTRMRIVLNPPNLGSLRVQLSVRDHVLNGTIQADSSAARELILSHLNSLKESLEEQGVKVGEFHVDVEQGFEQASHDAERGSDRAPSFNLVPPDEVRPADPVANDVAMRIRSARLQVIDLVA